MIQVKYVRIFEITMEIYQELYKKASLDRKNRADRYRHDEDRICCITADALLRYVVKKELMREVFEVERNSFGKPYVKDTGNFFYNISHSGDAVMIAYGDREVGVDVEKLRVDIEGEKLARRYFTDAECSYIFEAEEADRAERFFRIWTAKESYVKYLGTGLRKSLNSFDVLSMKDPVFSGGMIEDNYYMMICASEKVDCVERVQAETLL